MGKGNGERGLERFTVWDVNDSGHMALHWGAGEEEIDLIVRIAETTEIFDTAYCLVSLGMKEI